MKKISLFFLLMLCSLGVSVAIAQPQAKAAPADRQSQKQLEDYLKAHHINGVMLVNGKGSQPITITHNENANQKQDSIQLCVFTGGECTLLGEDLFKSIKLAKSMGLMTRIVTNGFWAKTEKTA